VYRTTTPETKKGFTDVWEKHLAFAKLHVRSPDFEARGSTTHATEDLLAAIDKSVELGAAAKEWRGVRAGALKKMAKRLRPLNAEIKRLAARPDDHPAVKAAPLAHIALLACLTEATGWPDKWLPYNMLYGFNVVGNVPDSGIFRPILPDISETEHLVLVKAIAATNQRQVDFVTTRLRRQAVLAASDPDVQRDLDSVFNISQKEWDPDHTKGGLPTMSVGRTEAQMNKDVGYGKWRPMLRFVVHQERKDRVIDDAKQSRTNESARLVETVTLPSFEWGAVFAGHVARAAARRQIEMPALCIGLDDMSRAYRQVL